MRLIGHFSHGVSHLLKNLFACKPYQVLKMPLFFGSQMLVSKIYAHHEISVGSQSVKLISHISAKCLQSNFKETLYQIDLNEFKSLTT